ncbi:CPBP family intramembrane glutamic endopeptidase [Chryseobacterium schmidteae]|uniref:CPBP family intramembrane glutamic endopeptidase n=1 Tax=Chryseobacterium schmidteae TaxID=2730404 RepID=UPI00158B98B4|nr:CPBP family intramembrane glutamic endopeptidase [Chryseobacterium schmidteae]
MKTYFIELFNFYKNPKDVRIKNYTLIKNIKYILYTFLADLSLTLIFFPFLYLLSKNNLIPEDFERINYTDNTLLKSLMVIAVFVPLLEEIIFRFPIRYNKLYRYFISAKLWDFLFKILVYIIPLLFGFVHLSNFGDLTLPLILMSPVLIGSQIIGGYLYTFLRVKFNFASAVVTHMLWNLVLSLGVIFLLSVEKPFQQNDQDLSIEIKQFEYNNLESQNLTIDSIGSKIFKVEAKQYSLNHVVDTIANEQRRKTDVIVDLKLTSKKGITKENFVEIIEDFDKSSH